MAVTKPPVLIAVSHGSADPRAAAANERLMEKVATLLPDVSFRLAYLDHRPPSVPEALAALAQAEAGEAVVLPLLLTVGYHSRTDIPALLAGSPLPVHYGRVLGPDPLLAEALDERLSEAGVSPEAPVVLAAAGSSEPDAARDVALMAGLLEQRRRASVRPAYASAIGPSVPEALAASGPGAAVALYFLAPGRLPDRVRRQASRHQAGTLVSQPLGTHPALVATVSRRYQEVRTRS